MLWPLSPAIDDAALQAAVAACNASLPDYARIGRWTASIAANGQPVVAVSHKATIRALLALATGWDMMGRPPHKFDWRCLHFFSAHAGGRVSIDRLNVPL